MEMLIVLILLIVAGVISYIGTIFSGVVNSSDNFNKSRSNASSIVSSENIENG